jgi:hypothetical protein
MPLFVAGAVSPLMTVGWENMVSRKRREKRKVAKERERKRTKNEVTLVLFIFPYHNIQTKRCIYTHHKTDQ